MHFEFDQDDRGPVRHSMTSAAATAKGRARPDLAGAASKPSAERDVAPQSDPAVRRRWLLLLLLSVVALGAASLLVHSFTPLAWNVAATRTVQSVRLPGLGEFLRLLSEFGNAPKIVFVAAIALLACNRRSESFWLAFSGLGGWFLAKQLKLFFASERPSADLVAVANELTDGSFPSGHVAFYVAFFGFIFFLTRERMARRSPVALAVMAVAVGFIFFVGVSRVYLGEHWLTDLPGSYLLGALWLALSIYLYRTWERAGWRRFEPGRAREK